MSATLYAQLLRGFRSALRSAGIALRWRQINPDIEPRDFQAIKNPLKPASDGVDRNQGDNTGCILTVAVEDFAGDVPAQGDTFTDAADRSYRIGAVESVPGHPLIHFTIDNVVTLP